MSIYKDDEGRWHGYVSMGLKDNGRRDRRHVSGDRRADVAAKVRELERKRDAGVAAAAGRPSSVAAWLDHWLATVAGPQLRPATITRYRLAIRSHLAPKVGHHRLDRLQPEHLEVAYLELVAGGLAASTVLYAHLVLSQALSVALRRGTLARNVATLVDPPRGRAAETEPLSQAEARAVLLAADGARNSARWSVGLASGLRQGEALGLTWARSVNLESGNLVVGQALQRIAYRHGCQASCGNRPAACHSRELDLPAGFVVMRPLFGGLVLVEPKSDAGHRTIAMPPQLVDALRAHRQTQLEERLLAGSVWEDHDLVFAQPNGRPVDPRRDWGAWKALCSAAGVRPSRVHDARHTAATLLLVQGVSPRVVLDVMGWSDQRMLLRYQHVIDELRRDAAVRMGSALWGAMATTVAPSEPTGRTR